MSTYQTFADLPAALEAFAARLCRRHVRIGGHVIDLVQAQAEAGRVREEPAVPDAWSEERFAMADRATWDGIVARNIAAEFAVPSEAAPAVECCRACGRPMIGGAS